METNANLCDAIRAAGMEIRCTKCKTIVATGDVRDHVCSVAGVTITRVPIARPCRFCGNEVVCRNPSVDYCERCYYDGRVQEDEHRALFDALNSADGIDVACVDHTGGGCFNMGIRLKDGRFICATEDNDPGIPDAGNPWGLITLWPDHENWGEGEPIKAIEGSWSDLEIVGVIRELIATT